MPKKTINYKLKTNLGFTLIELLIAVSISALLMTSVMVFMGVGLKNGTQSKKIAELQIKNFNFDIILSDTLENISNSGIIWSGNILSYSSGMIFLTNYPSNLTFIGVESFTGYCDGFTGSTNLTGEINKLVIKNLAIPSYNSGTIGNYTIKGNSIFSGGVQIIGKNTHGSFFDENNPLETELNNPSSISETSSNLYIADTNNSRILVYNKSSNKIKNLADYIDGINNPTDLYFTGGTLYIANTGGKNILKIKDSYESGGELDLNFKIPKNITFDSIKFSFDGITNIAGPISTGSLIFSGFSKGIDDFINTGSLLTYNFSGSNIFLNSGTTYGIKINNISPVPSNVGSYNVKLGFYNGATVKYEDSFPYYIKGDSLSNRDGNIIETLSGGIFLPNNLKNENSWDTEIQDLTGVVNNPINEIISNYPIKDLSYNINGKILTIKYSYYKYYDCLTGKHIIKEKVLKKYIK